MSELTKTRDVLALMNKQTIHLNWKQKLNMIKLQYILIKMVTWTVVKTGSFFIFIYYRALLFEGGRRGIHSLLNFNIHNKLFKTLFYFSNYILKKIKKNWSIKMCTPTYTHPQHVLETCIHAHAHVCSHIRYVMLSLVTKN